jgi:hypothetical protein
MKIVLLSLLLFFTISHSFSQGKIDGFYHGKGNGTAVLGVGFEDPKSYIAGREKVDLSRTLIYVNLFGSYGLSDNLDAQISIPYLKSNDNSNFQDVSVFLKYRFYSKGNIQLSLGGGFSTPLSNYTTGGLNDLGQRATILETRALLHYKFKNSWFGTLQSGYSYKLEEVPSSIPFSIKVGKATSKWYYDAFYEYQYSFGGTDYLGSPRPQNFREFGVDYHKIGSTVFRKVSNNFGVYLNVSYLLGGRNTFQGASYGLGLTYDF